MELTDLNIGLWRKPERLRRSGKRAGLRMAVGVMAGRVSNLLLRLGLAKLGKSLP
jgi:hypothetical protein